MDLKIMDTHISIKSRRAANPLNVLNVEILSYTRFRSMSQAVGVIFKTVVLIVAR